ncbi:hypothetical protein BD289DRAFT_444114 [Coniella lustricola]|uniref:Uncharacterized protein n=1 Tax=Coniella lustricola TaxID=2025994 RepID=A0A2T2ZW68_9PEZI|nr:hypothetical protein BD289DRAFT_444114 [Coniella lustricola]
MPLQKFLQDIKLKCFFFFLCLCCGVVCNSQVVLHHPQVGFLFKDKSCSTIMRSYHEHDGKMGRWYGQEGGI